jgi:cell division protein FtsQ
LSIIHCQLNYSRLYWILFLLVVGAILFSAVRNKKYSTADGVEAEVVPLPKGDKLISERDVRQALIRAFGTGIEQTELVNLEVENIEHTLEEDPFVKDAQTYVDQHNMLHIKIEQREPIMRVLDNNGNNYYLDENGVKMPPSKNFAARVLVVTGNVAPYTVEFKTKRKSSLKDAFLIVQTILNDEFLSDFIQQIHVNNAGEFILVPLIGDQKIVLGSARKLDDKFDRLKTFYKKGMPYTGWQIYKTINLKYSGQVVCKK